MFDVKSLLEAVGYLGVFGIVFAETGLLVGFFFPGDSLLFTAGILAAQGFFNIYLLILIMLAAAIIGDSVGYHIGRKLGPKVFSKEDSLLFKKSHIEKAQKFYEKHGPKTIMIAKFIPIIRTFAPTVAGMAKMNYMVFLFYSVMGALIWVLSVTFLGYFLGLTVPTIEHYIIPGIVVIVLISISPYLKRFIIDKELRDNINKQLLQSIKKIFKADK